MRIISLDSRAFSWSAVRPGFPVPGFEAIA